MLLVDFGGLVANNGLSAPQEHQILEQYVEEPSCLHIDEMCLTDARDHVVYGLGNSLCAGCRLPRIHRRELVPTGNRFG